MDWSKLQVSIWQVESTAAPDGLGTEGTRKSLVKLSQWKPRLLVQGHWEKATWGRHQYLSFGEAD